MGGHFYDCKGTPYLTEARTPVQARKIKAYPSVTTVLSIQMNDFLHNIWTPRKIVELARDNPTMPVQEIQELNYGQRVCPATGKKISSSSFGTSVHARLEEVLNHRIFGEGLENEGTPFDDWVEPFIDFIDENNIKPLATEKIVFCHKMKSAGSVDLIADVDGKVHLFDYKCRDTKGTGGKFYEEKDCGVPLQSTRSDITVMVDLFHFEAPLGILGKLANVLFLKTANKPKTPVLYIINMCKNGQRLRHY